eukprot:gb/GEZN01018418.1/.p1 GENE.gb/GEZN01018418.1/~~gb/GEZN01018418.1/.p1  ORF type:complete len:243 (-),score=3.42 gb/GEZN01018418.1/:28-681(-)
MWLWFGAAYVVFPIWFWAYVLSTYKTAHIENLTWSSTFRYVSAGLCLGTMLFFWLCILAGAPLFSLVRDTLLMALSLAWLCGVPSALVCRMSWYSYLKVYLSSPTSLKTIEGWLQLSTLSTLVGCMVGAYFLVLDHGTIWQVWPNPCLVGSLLGFLVSPLVLIYKGLTKKCFGRSRRAKRLKKTERVVDVLPKTSVKPGGARRKERIEIEQGTRKRK